MVRFIVSRRPGACALALCVLLLAASVGLAQDASGGKATLRYLAVGVSKTANVNNLQCAHQDALDCSAVWEAQKGKLYREVAGQTLVDEKATGANIRAELKRLGQQAQAGDTVIVSLSGHGNVAVQEGRQNPYYYFVPYDYDPARIEQTGVSARDLRDALAPLVRRGVTVVLILDTCKAGAMAPQDSGMIVMAACMGHELSQESPVLNNGLYTKALLEALQGKADLDQNGIITLAEVEAYVSQRVPQLLKQLHGPGQQNPTSGRPLTVPSNLPLASCLPSMIAPAPALVPGQSGAFVTGPVR